MQDMYLIPRYGDYRVVVIQKTNTKSYTLSDGSRINKEQFHKSAFKINDKYFKFIYSYNSQMEEVK